MVLITLVPILLYLLILRAFDAFSLVRWRSIALWLGWGMASALLILGIVKVAHSSGHAWTSPWVSPLLEEWLKALPLLYFTVKRKVVFTAETQLLGEAIGGGFALVENVIYFQHFHHMSVATALVRGLGTGLMHMGCTALVATLTLLIIQHLIQQRSSVAQATYSPMLTAVPSHMVFAVTPFLFVPSVALHTFHNTTSLSPMTFMVCMILVFFLAFWLVSRWGERNILRWLDVSISDDVALIAALREGRLEETKAGAYLTALRDRFQPLVFFDMCVYVQLYLELLIDAKARLMLHDAGISQEETIEQKSDRQARLVELDALHKRIPRLGLLLLTPLTHSTDQDRWVLRR